MRAILALCGCILVTAAAALSAQQPTPSTATLKTFASSADVTAIVTKLKAQPSSPLRTSPLLQLDTYRANIEYRIAMPQNAATHLTEAELFYVIDGGATLVTGGQLVDAQQQNPQNQTAKSISNGMSQHVSKGDFMLVPEGTPHWFSSVEGSITLMSIHLPRK
jgi:mannose-6-phosphate isomerase-like protein (cupin superfamily)